MAAFCADEPCAFRTPLEQGSEEGPGWPVVWCGPSEAVEDPARHGWLTATMTPATTTAAISAANTVRRAAGRRTKGRPADTCWVVDGLLRWWW
jgi:hypothetical protein